MGPEATKRKAITKCESAQESQEDTGESTTSSSALIILAGKREVTNVGFLKAAVLAVAMLARPHGGGTCK